MTTEYMCSSVGKLQVASEFIRLAFLLFSCCCFPSSFSIANTYYGVLRILYCCLYYGKQANQAKMLQLGL